MLMLVTMWLSTSVLAAAPTLNVPVDTSPVLEDRFPQHSVEFGPDVESRPDLVYSVPPGFRPLRLDLYRPRNMVKAAGSMPLVLYVHGGGWQAGHTRHAVFARWLGPRSCLCLRRSREGKIERGAATVRACDSISRLDDGAALHVARTLAT